MLKNRAIENFPEMVWFFYWYSKHLKKSFAMDNNIHVKLECSITDPRAICSLMELMVEKLRMIQSISGSVKRMEINLYDDREVDSLDPVPDKVALCRLISDQGQMTEYSRSKRWDDAVLITIDKIRERCSRFNPWERTK